MEKRKKRESITINGRIFTIYKYTRLESTNTFLRQHCMDLPDYTVIWAEEQTHGRGRFNRVWYSSPGKDLTFSILLPLESRVSKLRHNITQITALSVARLLEDYGLKPRIKWPNDVLMHEKKVCGILCEIVELDLKTYAVLGIGLNVNSSNESSLYFDSFVTSMHKELNRTVNRSEVFRELLGLVYGCFVELNREGFLQSQKEIKKRLMYVHERIVVKDGTRNPHLGKIIDLNHDGTLLFQCDECNTINLNSGEITYHINTGLPCPAQAGK
ncbi:MAG: biotin--[acetyl-CoA-carboxylase] ligase [Candidatus Scalindua sp.]|nr:biotin--[acetyl-CoA-carboxylase] ligase [Candidatus Scalindua sp.]